MKKISILLVFCFGQTFLFAQSETKDSRTKVEGVHPDKTRVRRFSVSVGPSIFMDLTSVEEGELFFADPFFGGFLSFDARLHEFSPKNYLGATISIGKFDGFYGRYGEGSIFKIGPKFFLGKPRKSATLSLMYFQFKDGFTYRGGALGVGSALISKGGFLFYPQIEYQFSFNKEEDTSYGPSRSLQNLALQVGLGYAF